MTDSSAVGHSSDEPIGRERRRDQLRPGSWSFGSPWGVTTWTELRLRQVPWPEVVTISTFGELRGRKVMTIGRGGTSPFGSTTSCSIRRSMRSRPRSKRGSGGGTLQVCATPKLRSSHCSVTTPPPNPSTGRAGPGWSKPSYVLRSLSSARWNGYRGDPRRSRRRGRLGSTMARSAWRSRRLSASPIPSRRLQMSGITRLRSSTPWASKLTIVTTGSTSRSSPSTSPDSSASRCRRHETRHGGLCTSHASPQAPARSPAE